MMQSTRIYTKTLSDIERDLVRSAVQDIVYPESDYQNYLIQIQLSQKSNFTDIQRYRQ